MVQKKTAETITVKLVRSLIGERKSTRSTVKGLGLKKVNSTATLQNNPSIQGMINKIPHLVQVITNSK